MVWHRKRGSFCPAALLYMPDSMCYNLHIPFAEAICMNVFFSHSSDDAHIVREMVDIFSGNNELISFYSSDPKTGVLAGEGVMARINTEISKCQYLVAIISENYVRSQYCMYELSVASFLQSRDEIRIIPIVSSLSIYEQISSILAQFDLLYVDASSPKAAELFCQTFPWVGTEHQEQVKKIMTDLSRQTVSLRPYIGMSQESYSNILEYCQRYGIKQFKNTTLPSLLLKEKVARAQEVILLSTTGASLIKILSADSFPKALSRGCKISVLLPNQYSAFCDDVAQIERPDAKEENASRLAQEYAASIEYLKDAVNAGGNSAGSITCYCASNLLRQTILLVRESEDSVWGWVSLTLPPKRTVDGTPSFEVEGKLEPGHMTYLLWQHCQAIMQVSMQRGTYFSVDRFASGPFFKEDNHAKEYWTQKYQQAQAYMQERRGQYDCALIEIAAQHPLKRRKLPGKEFQNRLDAAIQIYEKLQQEGVDCYFYVPGSRHRHNQVDDLVSLSQAGVTYLLSKGIEPDIIYGEDMNHRYKGDAGVYNSADECYVAAQIFRDGPFDRMICVCSPNQTLRKSFFYMEFGVLAQCFAIPAEQMFHNPVDEVFGSLTNVLYKDHSWQDPNGDRYQYYRNERIPRNSVD